MIYIYAYYKNPKESYYTYEIIYDKHCFYKIKYVSLHTI